jgi:hypothetical protein
MTRLLLKDVEKWRKLNKKNDFSLYDYIFHIFKSKKINSDIYFAFSEFFWPTFIIYHDYIFLKENFSEEKFKELSKHKEKIEFWMNLFIIDPYFEDDKEEKEKAKILAQILVSIWQSKLKQDFPDIEFTVEYLYDIECGDYGLTFYQTKK